MVPLFRRHLPAVAVVVLAAAAVGAFLLVTRPTDRREVAQPPRDHGLPYDEVSYTAADARRAFAATGIALTSRSRSAAVTTLGDRDDVLEVDAFGERALVERSGFYDYTVDAGGGYSHFPRTCGGANRNAERRRGNVRVIVSCNAAGDDAAEWLRRVERALERL